MLLRTVREWGELPIGDGDGAVTEAVADGLIAMARHSALGGENASRIISRDHRSLRAGQVVGVLATEACCLEILPKIGGLETGNIRHRLINMLAAVLDMDIAAGRLAAMKWQRETLLELVIQLFANKLSATMKRGMPRSYRERIDDLASLRGRLNVKRQFTTLAATSNVVACLFDDLSYDTGLNRAMKAAVIALSQHARSSETRRTLHELSLAYADVADVSPSTIHWDSIVLDRTNASWRELLALARLLLAGCHQSTSVGRGFGFSLLFEMNTLFERYFAVMLKRALAGSGTRIVIQGGRKYCLEDVETGTRRFLTRPDILLQRDEDTLAILDTKWKWLSPAVDDPKQGVSQADIYQMMAYGQIYHSPLLVLIYPHHAGLPGAEGVMSRHRVPGVGRQIVTATLDISNSYDITGRLRRFTEDLLAAAR